MRDIRDRSLTSQSSLRESIDKTAVRKYPRKCILEKAQGNDSFFFFAKANSVATAPILISIAALRRIKITERENSYIVPFSRLRLLHSNDHASMRGAFKKKKVITSGHELLTLHWTRFPAS